MKNKILLAATTAMLLTSATSFASSDCCNEFYVKVGAGAALFTQQKDTTFTQLSAIAKSNITKNTSTDLKMTSKLAPVFELGVGYYLMDNVRADATFVYLVNPQYKKTGAYTELFTTVPFDYKDQPITSTHKAQIMAFMINGYVELFDVSLAKVFAGVGAGAATVKEKNSYSQTIVDVTGTKGTPAVTGVAAAVAETATTYKNATWDVSTKSTTNFAYQITVGASTEVAPGVTAEVAYSYRDFGSSKSATYTPANAAADGVTYGKTAYRANVFTVGVRVSF